MAFDLLFYKKVDLTINLEDIVNYFWDKPNFSVKPLDNDLYHFIYCNDKTTTTFLITYSEKDGLVGDIQVNPEYEFCFMSFSLNYLKPSFYALEAMPIVYDFITKFNMLIFDVQNIDNPNTIKEYTPAELIDSYQKNNELTAIDFNKQYPLANISKEKLDYFYDYIQIKDNLNLEDTTIPEITFFKGTDSKTYTVLSWYDLDRTLLPKADLIVITRLYKGLFGLKKEKNSLLPYEEVINKMREYLVNYDNIKDCYLFTDSNNQDARKLFYELPEQAFDAFELISVDEIVDINL